MFENRSTAGRWLAQRVPRQQACPQLVLGISAAGLCVGAEVAERLGVPLDAWLARGLQLRGEHLGAVAEGRAVSINFAAARASGLDDEALEALADRARAELAREAGALRGTRWLPRVRGRAVVVVSDATLHGDAERAVLQAVAADSPAWMVLATPVATPSALEKVRDLVNEVIVLESIVAEALIYRQSAVPPLETLGRMLSTPAAALDSERFRHIAVGVDFADESVHAARLAAAFAERDNARLTLVHMTDSSHTDDPSHEVHQKMGLLAHSLRRPGLSVWTRVEVGVATDQLPSILNAMEADLLVVAGSHKRWLQRALHGSVSDRMVREAQAPVLVACEHVEATLPRKIVVAVDYTEASEIALRTSAAQAYLNAGHLEVTHVERNGPTEKLERFCRQRVHGFANSKRFSARRIEGVNASVALVHHARHSGAELLVVGSHDRGPLTRMLSSSTTEELLHALPCHVLVTPTPSHAPATASANLPLDVDRE